MAVKIASSSSFVISSSFQSRRTPQFSNFCSQVNLPPRLHEHDCRRLQIGGAVSCWGFTVDARCSLHSRLNTNQLFPNARFMFFASINDLASEIESDRNTDQEVVDDDDDDDDGASKGFETVESSRGRPGIISFYNQPHKTESGIVLSTITSTNQNNLFSFLGPAVLVASFIFPTLYMRKILSKVFEDSLLTDFLVLFSTEALFYCGVVVFLFLVDYLRAPNEPVNAKNSPIPSHQLVYRVTSVAALVLSLVIPMVTMGLVWPWTGPAACATLAPYLAGIVVQLAFEQYARYIKSPSWPLIPIIFQVYRLHQLNRAAQLVTTLLLTVRGAETTPHNLTINRSLGMLLNVLQFLGVICIWSLSNVLMWFLPSSTITEQ